MPLNVVELGLSIIRFISNLYGGVFFKRTGQFFNKCMLEKDVMVTQLYQEVKLKRVALVDNRPSTNKDGGPKQLKITGG